MRILLMLALVLLVSACAAPMVLMIHPTTEDIQRCGATGTTLGAAVTAQRYVENCVEQLQALGYIKVQDLTPEQRATLKPKLPPGQIEIEIRGR